MGTIKAGDIIKTSSLTLRVDALRGRYACCSYWSESNSAWLPRGSAELRKQLEDGIASGKYKLKGE